jgi:hypothetical protein
MREKQDSKMDDNENLPQGEDEELLQEIRDYYRYFKTYWEEVRNERQVDLRYLCGDPWEPEDRKARKDAGRPCINHDELNQYVNQAVNSMRQNRRGIKIEPRGNGATDKTAELHQDIARTIEYRSKAQSAYLRAYQDMLEGSYGFFRIRRKYVVDDPEPDDERALDQEIEIAPIMNADSVLYDPECKQVDWSDAKRVFVLDPISKDDFKQLYPQARKTDFTADDCKVAKDWIQDKTILTAEYWKVETEYDDFKRNGKSRQVTRKKVVQYITNGVEILERNPQPGTEIPIPSMAGLTRYTDDGGKVTVKIFSMVRLARDPQMTYAYLTSQETEEAGMTPRTPVMGYVGQFETDFDNWDALNKKPCSFIQVDPVPDPMNPNQVLPLPTRPVFTPNFQAYETAKDSCRRAVQAAMGISPLPTAAQRDNEKSGIALDKIQQQEAMGSLHFVDAYENAIARAGRIIEAYIPVVYDRTDREMGLQKANDTRKVVRANTAQPYVANEQTGETAHYPIGDEEHDVTISAGPSYQSQHDAAADFLDTLIAQLPLIAQLNGPQAASKLMSLAIQMRELGPLGDEMAEVMNPEKADQQGQMSQMQQQLAQQGQLSQQMQAELQKLQLEKAGKVIDNQFKMQIERMEQENKLAIAEIQTKAQAMNERLQAYDDMMAQFHSQAHDAGMQAQDQQHQQGLAAQQQAAAQQQQAAGQAHQQGMAAQQAQQQAQQPKPVA